jgi:hypothetical protein
MGRCAGERAVTIMHCAANVNAQLIFAVQTRNDAIRSPHYRFGAPRRRQHCARSIFNGLPPHTQLYLLLLHPQISVATCSALAPTRSAAVDILRRAMWMNLAPL